MAGERDRGGFDQQVGDGGMCGSVLFELIAERYERRSIAITSNAPFSAWDDIFPDKAMTIAAVDRLVHHATILATVGTQSSCSMSS